MAQEGRGTRAVWLVAAVTALVVAAACGGGGGGAGAGTGAGTDSGSQPAQPGAPVSAGANGNTFDDDVDGAIGTAEDYWKQQMSKQFGETFRPIPKIIPYSRAGQVRCGGEAMGRNNAAYCPSGDFIAFDSPWAKQQYDDIGDAFIYYMLDHEYAHGIQTRLGERYRYTIDQELQADCMAGATIGDEIRAKHLLLEPGDLDELRKGLIAVGDDPGQPWFAPGAHGTAKQRTDAFFAGYDHSLGACKL
jgi:predicted metalloprotease